MQYDAAIIGAGPAGATFARRLAQQSPELKILLLDAQDEGHKKPCGGLLAPDAQKTLAHFDLVLPKSVLADPQIFAVETMDLRTRRVRYYQRYYLNMDRYAFDRWLVSLVPPTVEIVRGRCTAVSRTDGGFVLTVRTAEGARSFACRCLIGADGVLAADHERKVHLHNLPARMVNTTGCGDAFMAAVARAFLDGAGLETAAKRGLAASAIAMESADTINPAMSLTAVAERIQ